MRPIRCLIALLSCLAPACATVATSTALGDDPPPMRARRRESVAIFSSGPPARPHRDASLITVEDPNRQGMDVIIDRLREKAAELGCDAVVLGSRSEREGSPNPFSASTTIQLGTCIVYEDPEPQPGKLLPPPVHPN